MAELKHMTTLQILLILNILTGRLIIDRDKYTSKKIFWLRSIFTLIISLFAVQLTDMLVIIILSTAIILLDIYWLKRSIKIKYTIFLLLLFIVLPGLVQGLEQIGGTINFDNPVSKTLIALLLNLPFIKSLSTKFNPNYILLAVTMYLFTIKESTIIIRGILDSIKAIPKKEEEKDEEEYNRGKYIGILERTFIYFLIIFQQYAAIGIVLGLKSFARYKELDKRGFAEYFLIGSMLSILTALLPAIYVLIQI